MTDLKPCPFCGGTPVLEDYMTSPRPRWVLMHRCTALGHISREAPTAEKLISKWNIRTGEGSK